MTAGATLQRYVAAFLDGLADSGVTDLCVVPGSRSTPLALVAARHPRLRVWVHLDERSAAFFALGRARVLRRPVAVLCTSGTAAANLTPAVHEAALARVPLLLLTADRPQELRNVGAPQTTDQLRLFGSIVKGFMELAPPGPAPDLVRYARATGARAAARAAEEPSGPVHCNLPFREPLIPDSGAIAGGDTTPLRVVQARRRPDPADLAAVAEAIRTTPRGLIICGPQQDPAFAGAVARLAAASGYPVLADPLSLVRCGAHDRSHVIDAYDAFLRDPAATALLPDLVIRFGQSPTSKPLTQFLDQIPLADGANPRQILITDSDGWNDFSLRADTALRADAAATAGGLATGLPSAGRTAASGPGPWLARWRAVDAAARAALEAHVQADGGLTEPAVFAALARVLPGGAACFAGSSMPVRDLDTFTPSSGRAVEYLANRGANGIDGVISAALGAASAHAGPLLLAIGDLSFYHDMNGLLAARRHGLRATIVLINNDGGGIFSFLPQADQPEHFELLFGTPHGLDFRHACALYGLDHRLVTDVAAFEAALGESLPRPGVDVIEVRTNRAANVTAHRACWTAVRSAIQPLLAE